MIDRHHGWNKSLKPLFLGFIFSLVLLVALFRLDVYNHLPPRILNFTTVTIAIVQVVLQLIFFFHLGLEDKPAWNLITFLFVVLVILIIVGGSIWIMSNLNYNLMPMNMPMD
ncbi:MAG: cytochrome o ubiquinol oxidase subunit IV [Verrucomicrobia bacterium]|nr:cytochrome o ubiquinol oxidase subunit IV [Verrucomicrobiota bacterium]